MREQEGCHGLAWGSGWATPRGSQVREGADGRGDGGFDNVGGGPLYGLQAGDEEKTEGRDGCKR